jgi:hypothetical protein
MKKEIMTYSKTNPALGTYQRRTGKYLEIGSTTSVSCLLSASQSRSRALKKQDACLVKIVETFV